MTRPAKTIALIADTLNFDYAQLLTRAVWRESERRGVAVLTVVGNRLGIRGTLEAAQNHIFELISARRVDGVVSLSAILTSSAGTAGVEALCKRYAPLPVCSVGVAIAGVPSLLVDNASGTAQGVRHLIKHHGRSKIAFIGGPKANPEANDRLAGYKQVLASHGLPIREELIEHGDFTLLSGREAMLKLLGRSRDFDALVAANDYMALAGVEVLRDAGLRVPEDVAVCGFDDINAAACSTPPLTSLRQPLWQLGTQAVTTLVDIWEGRPVADCVSMPLSLVVRDSCGCKHHVAPTEFVATREGTALEALCDEQHQLEARLKPLIQVPNDALGEWPRRVFDAVEGELLSPGAFLPAFEALLVDAHRVGVNLSEFQQVVTEVRRSLQSLQKADELTVPEHIWHQARIQCCDRSIQMLGRQRIEEQQTVSLLGRSSERLATSLSIPRFRDVLTQELPALGVQAASISLVSDPRKRDELTPLLLLEDGVAVTPPVDNLQATSLGPDGVFGSTTQNPSAHRVVLSLTFESDFLGVAVLDTQCILSLYDAFRQQMGAALKGALLHRQVIDQTAVRERFERERVLEATRLASELQTKLNPRRLDVQGLEIAATLLPAAEAGGDYFDVIPTPRGAWLGVGDVTGHGLNAGVIMMMMHSMISGLVHHSPRAKPSELIVALNRGLHSAIHQRLQRDEHATLLLLEYESDGNVTYAGAHEPPIVYRSATGECEIIEPDGFWVGAVPDVVPFTRDASFRLEDGDVLLLYTDGLVEPRNAHNEQFGTERLGDYLKRWAKLPVDEVRERLLAAARDWTNDWTDDVTLMVIRYCAPAVG
jgi:phosphoserine phosphatase RsbU/P